MESARDFDSALDMLMDIEKQQMLLIERET
jgi:hypothetical protein